MPTHPDDVRRRIPLDEIQLQVVFGSLLGDAMLVGDAGARRLRVGHAADRLPYATWKYERLGALVAVAPRVTGAVVTFETVAHPVFDDLAHLFYRDRTRPRMKAVRRDAVLARLTPLGLAVWMSDVGRLQLRADSFIPAQEALALTA
ncbi:MAG: hypothetical protein AABZ26_03485 [Chloroflexota bacterium]